MAWEEGFPDPNTVSVEEVQAEVAEVKAEVEEVKTEVEHEAAPAPAPAPVEPAAETPDHTA